MEVRAVVFFLICFIVICIYSYLELVNEPLVHLKINSKNACTDQIDCRTVSLDSDALKLFIHGKFKAK